MQLRGVLAGQQQPAEVERLVPARDGHQPADAVLPEPRRGQPEPGDGGEHRDGGHRVLRDDVAARRVDDVEGHHLQRPVPAAEHAGRPVVLAQPHHRRRGDQLGRAVRRPVRRRRRSSSRAAAPSPGRRPGRPRRLNTSSTTPGVRGRRGPNRPRRGSVGRRGAPAAGRRRGRLPAESGSRRARRAGRSQPGGATAPGSDGASLPEAAARSCEPAVVAEVGRLLPAAAVVGAVREGLLIARRPGRAGCSSLPAVVSCVIRTCRAAPARAPSAGPSSSSGPSVRQRATGSRRLRPPARAAWRGSTGPAGAAGWPRRWTRRRRAVRPRSGSADGSARRCPGRRARPTGRRPRRPGVLRPVLLGDQRVDQPAERLGVVGTGPGPVQVRRGPAMRRRVGCGRAAEAARAASSAARAMSLGRAGRSSLTRVSPSSSGLPASAPSVEHRDRALAHLDARPAQLGRARPRAPPR